MLVREDIELEEAAMEGQLCIAVPVSVYVPETGDEPVITAYENVWKICMDIETKYGADILTDNAVAELFDAVAPVAEQMGYEADRHESRVIREYRISDVGEPVERYADGAVIIGDAAEIAGFSCPLLHKPDPDPDDDDDVCAVVIADGVVCAVAGINDISDDDSIEIFVETAKEYRGRGFGTAAVAALVRSLTENGYTVAYDCAETNVASSAIAEKLEMTMTGRRMSVVCYAK